MESQILFNDQRKTMIIAYVGLPRSGKTYSIAKDALGQMQHRHVFANFHLVGAHGYRDLKEVLGVRKGLIIADEVNILCPAYLRHKLPMEYLSLWTQSGKKTVDMYYSTQSFEDVDVRIRRITNFVWDHKRLIGRLHVARLYKGRDFERGRKHKPLRTHYFYLTPKVWDLYDTFAVIEPAEHLGGLKGTFKDPMDLPLFGQITQPEASGLPEYDDKTPGLL